MKVVFMGTPDFAVPVLDILAQKHDVICVYCQPPRPAGKGMKLRPSPIQNKAESLGILVRTPKSLKSAEEQQAFADLKADVAVVCAYGLILPIPVLKAPKFGCINVHASLLPRWRGAAPIQRAIEAGDDVSGVTIMQMDAGLDTGDMLLKGEVPITSLTTAGMLHDQLSELGARLIADVLDKMPVPVPQPQEGATYAQKIQKTEALINWNLPADVIERKIRAFNPFPGAYFICRGERIKVFEATLEPPTEASIMHGLVLDDHLLVGCGDGTALRLKTVQREGKRPSSAEDFLNGFELKKGALLAV